MIIKDEVYGEEKIEEPVLKELLLAPSLLRLKGISQFGMPEEYYHKKIFSRYDHSVGVLILLRRLGAGIEEQVSGLLHDVSHTAFSHVIDWVLGDPTKENYQDESHLDFIKNSELPKILEKYNLDYKNIAEVEGFLLLEKELPDLCADRIDYSLRELNLDGEVVLGLFSDLSVENNEIFFRSKKKAEVFAKNFLRLQKEHWGGDEARGRYYILSEILKEALKEHIISLEDLKKSEDWPILRKLEKEGNKKIKQNLDLLKNKLNIQENSKGVLLKKKFRSIDPKVLFEGKLVLLSEVSEDYKKLLESERRVSLKMKRILFSTQ